jgi:hypothetical protein
VCNLRQAGLPVFSKSFLCGGKKPFELLGFFRRNNCPSDLAFVMLG